MEVAVAQFDGEGRAVLAYQDARDRPGGEEPWMQRIGFVERHHSGRLLLRGTFAGHYLDVDEGDHVSERGGAEGAVTGGIVGLLLGPPGIAVGITLGALIGSQTGSAPDVEAEPRAFAEQVRAVVPNSSSAVVLISEPGEVDAMLAALQPAATSVTRRTLSAEETSRLEAALSETPPAA